MRTKHQDFEDTYPTHPGVLPQRQPLTGGFGRGGACPANLPAEACTELGAEPRGKHRAGAPTSLALWLRRVLS